MVYDDDYLQLMFEGGVKHVTCKAAGVSWPPPERIDFGGIVMVRQRYSSLTDLQRAGLTRIKRGAEYFPERAPRRRGEDLDL